MRSLLTSIFFCLLAAGSLLPGAARAQVVAASPTFFTENTPVTLTFDATQGNGALAGFTGNVYLWSGVVTNQSPTNTTWRYTHGANFGQADPSAQLTRASTNPNRYTITLTPRSFYAVPAGETILRLGMIFKDAAGNTVGRSSTGGDIFVDVWQGQFAVRITEPAVSGTQFLAAGTAVPIAAEASQIAQLDATLNGVLIGSSAGPANGFATGATLTTTGRNVIRVTATSGAATVSDSVVFFVRPLVTMAPLPASVVAGLEDGVTYVSPTSAVLVLTAPGKQFVYAIGEWNGFQPDNAGFMNLTPDGTRWWVQLNGLTAGQQYAYQFLVDGALKIADPYAELILDPSNDNGIPAATYPNRKPYPTGQTTGIVSVLQTQQTPYVWQATNYQRPKETDLVVYELLVRDFVARRNFQTIRDTLDYLQRLGVTAIELMPVPEFEGNDSWGYGPSFMLALDKFYGTRDAYRQLIDECHARGMAVIMDVAMNHQFGQSPMVQLYFDGTAPTTASPWFNRVAKHDFNVGYDMNHESPFTKYWAKRVMRFWLENFKVDGFRFDLAKGFTQTNTLGNTGAWGNYDASRVAIWKDYADYMWSVDSTAYVVLEYFATNTEERELANYHHGMMPWGNAHPAMVEVAKGNIANSDFSYGLSYLNRGFTRPRLMGFAESHDEERLMVESLTNGNQSQAANGYNVRTPATALARQELVAAFLLAVPGPKMLYEFDELGYDIGINTNGRTGAKPPRWQYYQDANRRHLYEVYRAMNQLRRHPSFETSNYLILGAGASLRTVRVTGPGMSTLVIGNLAVVGQTTTPNFPQGGIWYDYLHQDSVDVTANPGFSLAPGEYRVLTTTRLPLPANSTLLGLAVEAALTARTGLSTPRAYPNPAATGQALSIAYELACPATVRATVLDVLGRAVATLPAARQDAGFQTLDWRPTVAPGTYLVRVEADGGTARTVRIVVR